MVKEKLSVLVVDDNKEVAHAHAQLVEDLGFQSYVQTDPSLVENQLSSLNNISIALLDIQMPKINGIELLRRIKLQKPYIGVIMATVVNDIEQAVNATKCGAYNYLLKPLKEANLKRVLDSFLTNHPRSLTSDPKLATFITADPQFEEIFRRVKTFSQANVNVLIEGETGTGKELIAQLIHSFSENQGEPFLPVNVAAISEQLFESELFGHRKGSFTGASTDHDGYFETSKKGTLFLDEIGELGLEQQKKLLRVLQSHMYTRIGETQPRRLEARVVLATNRNLRDEIQENKFREDLYYRLASHIITLPPLRERLGDIEILSNYFLEKYCAQYGRSIEGLSDGALELLKQYSFPGNVRELEGIISGAVLIEQTPLVQLSSLPSHVMYEVNRLDATEEGEGVGLKESKFRQIMRTMAECHGNQTHAAKKLGVARGTLNRWLKEYRESGQLSG